MLICLKIIVKVKETVPNMLTIKKRKPDLVINLRNSPKKKMTIIEDSMIKYPRRGNLSSKVATHPGSTTGDMLVYIKPVVKKKPDLLVIHTRTNNFANSVKTMKEVRNPVKCVRELDKDQEFNVDFSSVINRSYRKLGQEINQGRQNRGGQGGLAPHPHQYFSAK